MIREITLTRGLTAIVDADDFERLSQFRWFALSSGRPGGTPRFVAARTIKTDAGRKTLLMHREVLGAPPNFEVDHVNRNPLDNRKSNLRLATRSQNCANRRTENSTGYRGVSPHRRRFKAVADHEGTTHRIGIFPTAVEAAQAYDRFARAHHGAFAVLNFPLPQADAA